MFLKYISPVLNFFQGTYAKFGTSSNLLREVSVSVITAVAVATMVQLLTPKPTSPLAEVRDLMAVAMAAQHQADSLRTELAKIPLQQQVDELRDELKKRDEQDSLRANAGLSTLDAMRKINRAIHPLPRRGNE